MEKSEVLNQVIELLMNCPRDRWDLKEQLVGVIAELLENGSSHGIEVTSEKAKTLFVGLCKACLVSDSLTQSQLLICASCCGVITNILSDHGFLLEERINSDDIVTLAHMSGLSDTILNPNYRNMFLALLSNLTIPEESCKQALESLLKSKSSSSNSKSSFDQLMSGFLAYNPQLEDDDEKFFDSWQYMSNVLVNFCRFEEAQEALLLPSSNFVKKLLSQIKSKNDIRRFGAVASIRSCLFKADRHWRIVVEDECLSDLLGPLVVGSDRYEAVPEFTDAEKKGMGIILWPQAELPNKTYESNPEILQMLLDCIRLLCQKRVLREELRKRKVYCIIRNLDLALADNETLHEPLFQPIRDIVDLLQGDEAPEGSADLEVEADLEAEKEELELDVDVD